MSVYIAAAAALIVLSAMFLHAAKHPKSKLITYTIGTYVALFAMLFPLGSHDSPQGFVRNIITSLVETAQVFSLNREFEVSLGEISTSAGFAWAYSIALALLFLAAPVLSASFLITFSRRARSGFKWMLNHKREVWIFSEPSDKAVLFAESVLRDKSEDICAVFCNADERYDRVAEIGAVALLNGIDELDEAFFNRRPATLLFMSDDDERNLEQTMDFVQKRKGDIRRKTLLYCFSSRPEAGLMLNAIDRQTGGMLRFRRVAENRAVVYRELLEIAKGLRQKDKKPGDTLHFMIVGCGWIGTELLKALLWCFVRYELVIDVIDKADARMRFFHGCPGLKAEEEGRYSIRFLPSTDIHTFDISDMGGADDIDYAFVALGNDLANLECAVYLRQAFRRLHRKSNTGRPLNEPEIHVVINRPGNRNLELIDHGTPYDITPFIGGQSYYTTRTLLDYTVEKQALLCHISWMLFYANADIEGGDPEKRRKAQKDVRDISKFIHKTLKDGKLKIANHAQWREMVLENNLVASFYKSDYDSWSSRARAVFDMCDRRYRHSAAVEHRRWIMYMLTEGYQYNEITDHVAKLHCDIGKQTDDERDMRYQELLDKLTRGRRGRP